MNGDSYKIDDFCYKPITGKGCIVTSPLQYWKSDYDALVAEGTDLNVKKTAECIAPANATERVCFDRIGVPVMQFTIFGKQRCEVPKKNECSSCLLDVSGLMVTFLLYNNEYSLATAENWEKDVFIRNVKSFNQAMGQDYHTSFAQYPNLDYNQDLISKLQGVLDKYEKAGAKLNPVKADYMSERSIPDNIEEETSENTFVVVISYILMFLYVGCAIGHLPSRIHSKFALGFSGIFVVLASLISAIGIVSYTN